MIVRLAAAILVAILAAVPLAVRPGAPVTWIAGTALVIGVAGALGPFVPLVTASGVLALIAYALGVLIAGTPVDPLAAVGLGAILVLLLALVHFAERVAGAHVGPGVLASQLRQWLAVVATGVLVAVLLIAAATPVGSLLHHAALPLVVAAGALGALITVAGAMALVAPPDERS